MDEHETRETIAHRPCNPRARVLLYTYQTDALDIVFLGKLRPTFGHRFWTPVEQLCIHYIGLLFETQSILTCQVFINAVVPNSWVNT